LVHTHTRIRVVLVDDHPVVREGLRTVLHTDPGIDLVGEAADGAQALEIAGRLLPDVMLLDIQLPGRTGLEVLRELKSLHPQIGVVILTTHDSEVYFVEAMRTGASGYLLKDAPHELLGLAVRTAALGVRLVPPGMLDGVIRGAEVVTRRTSDPTLDRITSQLTPRELDVLRLLARGAQNRVISEELHLAEVTVKKYVQSVVAKLAVPDRTQAALLAARLGLAD
jgi:DNA-binding NarL/FixJ family response regulator